MDTGPRRDILKKPALYLAFLMAFFTAGFLNWLIGESHSHLLVHLPQKIEDRPSYLYSLTGGEKGALEQPVAVAVSEEKELVYVADVGTDRVCVFDKNSGRYLYSIGERGKGAGEFNYPYGLAVFSDGRLWVSDPENFTVQEFDAKGRYLRTIGVAAYGIKPGLMCLGQGGRVYISDLARHRIVIFDARGRYMGEIKAGLTHPQGILADSSGSLWVVDEAQCQIKKITGKKVVCSVIVPGRVLPLGMVKGLAADNLYRLMVTQPFANRVLVYDGRGRLLFTFGQSEDLEEGLNLPVGITVDEDGRIYVANRGDGRVAVWGYPG
ncbi:6-bladed beta-propeller [Thermincola potens]|uniref:NHL repeat containing protein n=1 Tax=Thermincola potens (strain JR) TaxID=635013 RepID=D5X9G1_THEPJ|nr:6-bladed beta-propeller [Thermincola potens]ADG83065.1 NHL repeat containing protein [Thermincola potens JR]